MKSETFNSFAKHKKANIDKLHFSKIMEFIKENEEKTKKLSKSLQIYFEDKDFTGVFDNRINTFLIKWLEEVFGDKYKWIEYYIYELDWGKNGKDCITLKNGKKESLQNFSDLYDYISK